jgi:hypothetical protein
LVCFDYVAKTKTPANIEFAGVLSV